MHRAQSLRHFIALTDQLKLVTAAQGTVTPTDFATLCDLLVQLAEGMEKLQENVNRAAHYQSGGVHPL